MLLRDITSELIPFTTTEYNVCIALIILLALSSAVDMIIMYALIKQRSIPMDSQIILSFVAADFCFSTSFLSVLVKNVVHGGFAIGRLGCQCMAILIVTFLGASICSVFDMCLHRYLLAIHNIIISQKTANILIFFSWILPFTLITLIDLVFGNSGTIITLSSDKMYCLHNLYSEDTVGILGTMFIFLFIFCTTVFQIFAYYKIVTKYLKAKAKKSKKLKVKSLNDLVNLNTSSNEFRLIKKAVLISGTFAICWSVFVVKILYEFWTKQPISFYYDIVWDIVGCCTPIINAIILYRFDGKVHQNVNEIFFVSFTLNLYRRSKECIRSLRGHALNHASKTHIPEQSELSNIKVVLSPNSPQSPLSPLSGSNADGISIPTQIAPKR